MKKTVLLIMVDKRKKAAVTVQKVLTGWGCLIKTRLGIHDAGTEGCSEAGLIILELIGTSAQKKELARKLSILPGVKTKLVDLSL